MASNQYLSRSPAPISMPQPGAVSNFQANSYAPNGHPGMFAPGTKVQVGQHRVIVDRYLSEGGFAHVYVVRIPRSENKYELAVLKRVAVPDKEMLANMRTEVETMKKLKGHKHIVSYIDSHASQLKAGGYEVFLLMEYCQGGGLIDFMNTRLQHRLTEPEIMKIFSDVAEGVACMHYLKPPLLHRDLKVENVLISTTGTSRTYKLCDFGSTAPPRPAANSAKEARLIEDDVQRHTTMQYRSPEMVDVYRKQPINEKSDIWALGVLLYKLCYYTTPFEEQGQMAILNASYKYPSHPSFSNRIKKLIASMLRETPESRPNIYQVIHETCSMRNTPVPIKDIYAARSQSEARRFEQLPSPDSGLTSPVPTIGIQRVSLREDSSPALPEIAPMRRGRPTTQPQLSVPSSARQTGSRGSSQDPFAALDSKAGPSSSSDDISGRFPSIEQFSILHDRGTKFDFDDATSASPGPVSGNNQDNYKNALGQRVAETLADEAFGQLRHAKSAEVRKPLPDVPPIRSTSLRKPSGISRKTQQDLTGVKTSTANSTSPAPKSSMISTGVQTSPMSTPPPPSLQTVINDRPIWRVPQAQNAAPNMMQEDQKQRELETKTALPPRPEQSPRPGLLSRNRTKSQTKTMQLELPTSPIAAHHTLEPTRPSELYIAQFTSRSKSVNPTPRQNNGHIDSTLDYLREREGSNHRISTSTRTGSGNLDDQRQENGSDKDGPDNITSNVEFLRAMEEEEDNSKKSSRRRSSSLAKKRASLPAISLSGTRNMFAGRFGDAFRRFEQSNAAKEEQQPDSPAMDEDLLRNRTLTPIAGSEATGTSGRSDDEAIDETEDLPPEIRRELERRRLSQEERRVAAAAAEYRQRLQNGGVGAAGPGRVSNIQSRIQNLVVESTRVPPPVRTAEGYGKYTDDPNARPVQTNKPPIAQKAITQTTKTFTGSSTLPALRSGRLTAPITSDRTGPRPNVAPKPQALRTGGPVVGTGRPLRSIGGEMGNDDDEATFTKKFPSLAGLELVDMDFEGGDEPTLSRQASAIRSSSGLLRVRDV